MKLDDSLRLLINNLYTSLYNLNLNTDAVIMFKRTVGVKYRIDYVPDNYTIEIGFEDSNTAISGFNYTIGYGVEGEVIAEPNMVYLGQDTTEEGVANKRWFPISNADNIIHSIAHSYIAVVSEFVRQYNYLRLQDLFKSYINVQIGYLTATSKFGYCTPENDIIHIDTTCKSVEHQLMNSSVGSIIFKRQ
jgi:hypothetical protein